MRYKIIKNKDFLHKKTEPVSDIQEGQDIAMQLIEALEEMPHAIGLSANQIGISKAVSVVRVKKEEAPLILMNPSIIESITETPLDPPMNIGACEG